MTDAAHVDLWIRFTPDEWRALSELSPDPPTYIRRFIVRSVLKDHLAARGYDVAQPEEPDHERP